MGASVRAAIALLVLFTFQLTVYAQEILLRHRFEQGQAARAKTVVDMKGDSLISGEKAATDLHIEMMRDFAVNQVDPSGSANMTITVQDMNTRGNMESANKSREKDANNFSQFNEQLGSDRIQQVMMGASQMNLMVSPNGYVSGDPVIPLSQMGISLPSGSLLNNGGFEFPTFPGNAVRVGDSWTESGFTRDQLQKFGGQTGGEMVYKLLRIQNSPHGRVGVIHYQKSTDLSGLGLGGVTPASTSSVPGMEGLSGAIQGLKIPNLKIQLEGEIYFNIDKGAVVETIQQGLWNINFDVPYTNDARKKSTPLEQKNMKIRIHTQFLWNKAASSGSGQPAMDAPQINPIEVKQPEVP